MHADAKKPSASQGRDKAPDAPENFNTPQALPGTIFSRGLVKMKDGLPGIRRNRDFRESAVY
jgi:hypothetical protein